MAIHLIVVYCMILNPTMCKTLEMVPEDYRPIASIMECMMGGALGATQFTLDHMEWQVKGWRCTEKSTSAEAALDGILDDARH